MKHESHINMSEIGIGICQKRNSLGKEVMDEPKKIGKKIGEHSEYIIGRDCVYSQIIKYLKYWQMLGHIC